MDKRTVRVFYVLVMQLVLIFGSEMWVLTSRVEKSFKGIHHQAVHIMAGMGPKHQLDVMWVYPPIEMALLVVGLEEIGVYIAHRQNMVTQCIETHPIIDLCLAV